jgi:hypothetical protein
MVSYHVDENCRARMRVYRYAGGTHADARYVYTRARARTHARAAAGGAAATRRATGGQYRSVDCCAVVSPSALRRRRCDMRTRSPRASCERRCVLSGASQQGALSLGRPE